MANLHCTFKAGKIIVEQPRRISARKRVRLLGNGWRGSLVIAGAVLWIYGLWELGLIVLALASMWSVVYNLVKNWHRIYARQKVLLYLRQGRTEEALEICGEPEPLSLIWWRRLFLLFKQQRWSEAVNILDALGEGKERDYLLAVAYLGKSQPEVALGLCPSRPDGQWQILKAEALFQLNEWRKVLGVLRRSLLKDRNGNKLEHAWLKGGSYYYLGQYKPAIKLLRQVVEQDEGSYTCAHLWLEQALSKLE